MGNELQKRKLAELQAERRELGKLNFAAAKTHSQLDEVIERLKQLDDAIAKVYQDQPAR